MTDPRPDLTVLTDLAIVTAERLADVRLKTVRLKEVPWIAADAERMIRRLVAELHTLIREQENGRCTTR